MSFREVTSAGDSVDELPNEPTVDSTQSSPGRRTDWDDVTVFPEPPVTLPSRQQSLTSLTKLRTRHDEPLSFQQVQLACRRTSRGPTGSTRL